MKTYIPVLVVCLGLILFAVLGFYIPALIQSKTVANELATKHNIYVFSKAELIYGAAHPTMYGTISDLAEDKLIDANICSRNKCLLSGYVFTIKPISTNYYILAVPLDPSAKTFCSNISGIVRTDCYSDTTVPVESYN